MKKFLSLITALLLFSHVSAKHHKSDELKSIFNGKNLDGWSQKNGTATYRVEDGTIVGKTKEGSPNSFLCSNKLYGDFDLQFEVRLINDELNSGVQIRSQTRELNDKEKARGDKFGRVNGPQVEIEATKEKGAESGYVYGEALGGWMTPKDNENADSIFTYDPSFMTKKGAILLSPGKSLRKGEEKIHEEFYKNNNIPIIGKLSKLAIAEGGDMFWLDKETLVIGKGFRTNQIAIEQITSMLSKINVDVVSFDIPFFLGREACLHMMSLISIVDEKKALVYFSLLPVGLVQLLEKKGYELIEAPEDEFISSEGLNINVLAIKPGICVMISGCPKTKKAIEKKGITVYTFDGDSLCIGCEGGPTCLTRPILRV